jgi:hypothetical protein
MNLRQAAHNLTARRAKDFSETGNYEVEVHGQIVRIYRDPESGYWYRDSHGHFTQNLLGFTKDEALDRLAKTPPDEHAPTEELRRLHMLYVNPKSGGAIDAKYHAALDEHAAPELYSPEERAALVALHQRRAANAKDGIDAALHAKLGQIYGQHGKRILLRGIENGGPPLDCKTLGIPADERLIDGVWSVLDYPPTDIMWAPLVHHRNAFHEDIGHDWNISRGKFRFYGHSGEKGERQNLLVVLK